MIKKLFGFSIGTWLGALIAFVALPLSTHLYTQQVLGEINYYFSIINIVFTFILCGLDQAFLRYYVEYNNKETKDYVFSLNLLITIILIIVLLMICIPFSDFISFWLLDRRVDYILLLFAIHLIGLVITRYFQILYRLNGFVIKFAIISITNTILLKVIYIGGLLINTDAVSSIVISGMASIVIGISIILFGRRNLVLNLSINKQLLLEEFRYAMPILPTMFFAIFNNYLPILFLRKYSDFESIAIYSVSITISSIITLVHNGFNTYFEPFVFNNYKENKMGVIALTRALINIMLFSTITLILFQDAMFLIFNKSYSDSTRFLPIVICSALWYGVGDFGSIGIKIAKKMTDNFYVYLFGLVVNIILCCCLIEVYGLIGAALATAIASACICLFKIYRGSIYYSVIDNVNKLLCFSVVLLCICGANYFLFQSTYRNLIVFFIWIWSLIYLDILSYIKKIVKILI